MNKEKQYAVTMILINIGELVKHLTEDFCLENKHIPWKQITGLRNIAAHSYEKLQMADIWENVANTIPLFQNQIEEIIRKN
jgi:uncharacterized protein with HEPN domain